MDHGVFPLCHFTALATGTNVARSILPVIHSERLEFVATTRFFERITRKTVLSSLIIILRRSSKHKLRAHPQLRS